ncbi:MAG TPA: VanZ family protein [Crocinitomicaceae bacterium]|nr:VanZ family protein [Crocinitomicaceae bacterium]
MKTLLKLSLVIVIIGIAYLSLTPTEIITVGNDKISHFIAYCVLMTNVGLLTYVKKKQLVFGIVFCILYGVLIEIIQHFVPGRVMSGWDMVANIGGVLLGVITTAFLYKRIQFLLK